MPAVVPAIEDVIAGARVLPSHFAHHAPNRAALWAKLQSLCLPKIGAPDRAFAIRDMTPSGLPLPAENFAHLPVVETIEIVPEAVQRDPDLYERISEERTFEVDVIEPKLVKREIVRPKYRHRLDRGRPPVIAPAPARPVPGGYASAARRR